MNDTISSPSPGSVDMGVDGYIATILLNNRTKLNALSQSLWEAIPSRLEDAVIAGARVLIISGAGKNFCAGADISEFGAVRKNAETARRYETANEKAFTAIRNAPVPVIAKIEGICFGGGFGLAAACDLRVSSSTARFSVPAAKLGLAYPVSAMANIVSAVGAQNAKRLLYTADRYNAREMAAMGFVGEVYDGDDLDDKTDELAQRIASLAPLTHRATKASVAAALGGDAQVAEQLGAKTFNSADYAEGRAAFFDKRSARFKGL